MKIYANRKTFDNSGVKVSLSPYLDAGLGFYFGDSFRLKQNSVSLQPPPLG